MASRVGVGFYGKVVLVWPADLRQVAASFSAIVTQPVVGSLGIYSWSWVHKCCTYNRRGAIGCKIMQQAAVKVLPLRLHAWHLPCCSTALLLLLLCNTPKFR